MKNAYSLAFWGVRSGRLGVQGQLCLLNLLQTSVDYKRHWLNKTKQIKTKTKASKQINKKSSSPPIYKLQMNNERHQGNNTFHITLK